MKSKILYLLIAVASLAGIHQAAAQGARFFRISGPAATTITEFRPDGTLVWSNALAGTNYIVQTATSLGGGSNWVDYVQLPVTQAVNTNLLIDFNPPPGMTLIPAGAFTMGDTVDGSLYAIPTNATVSGFYMDVNLVTLSQWQSVYFLATNHGYTFVNAGSGMGSNHPVHTVDWYDSIKWCNARSEQAGLTPVYYADAGWTQVYTNGETTNVFPNWAAAGFRLPTEAEWEKAARGGLTGKRFPWGDTISQTQANYYSTTNYYSYDLGPTGYNAIWSLGSRPYTSPVGYFPPNGYGLYDMAGNVFQWCWNWDENQPHAGGIDPRGPASGQLRGIRGGSWEESAGPSRCDFQALTWPLAASFIYGFRCVRGL